MSKRKRKGVAWFTAVSESIKMAGEAIRVNKLRSILTCLGIIIGVATVISMMAIVGGINDLVEGELSRIGANVFFVQRFPAMQISFDWRKYRSRPQIERSDWEAISRRCKTVRYVSPVINQGGIIVSFGGEKTNPDVNKVATNDAYMQVYDLVLSEGRFFSPMEVQKKRKVCVLGMTLVEKLFPYSSPLGQNVRLDGIRFLVIGVLEAQGTIFGYDQDNVVYIPISHLNTRMHHWYDVSVAVSAIPGIPVSRSMDEVRSILRIKRGLKAKQEDNFMLETRDSILKTYQSMTGSIFAAAIGIALISLLVGGIGIMNIMLVSVRERTREIGIRKAIGAKQRDILWQFLIEAMALSVSGGVLGMTLGIGAMKLITVYTDKLPVNITVGSIIIAVVFSMCVGIFFGVYPARKASRLDPIECLRYE